MSIFSAISPPSASAGNTPLPLCREVAWDFQRDIPVFRQGEPVTVEGKEAVKVWIWRALRTPRYRYEIYSRTYGSEFESLIGHACTDALKEAEAPRYLRECLEVSSFDFTKLRVKALSTGSSGGGGIMAAAIVLPATGVSCFVALSLSADENYEVDPKSLCMAYFSIE